MSERNIRNTNVAVIGGAGFLGSHLTNHLIDDRGCEVLVVDNLCAGRREFVHPKAEFVHYDITGSEEFLTSLFRAHSIRYVFNYAAWPYIPNSFTRPLHVANVNFFGAMKVINAAQDAIIRAVSREGTDANRFLVGDVKQSIYRFRLADPRIFQNYEANWRSHEIPSPGLAATLSPSDGVRGNAKQTGLGQTLALTENFRSAEGLLNFINPVFRALMRPIVGGLIYDANAELQFGARRERALEPLRARVRRQLLRAGRLHRRGPRSRRGAPDRGPDPRPDRAAQPSRRRARTGWRRRLWSSPTRWPERPTRTS